MQVICDTFFDPSLREGFETNTYVKWGAIYVCEINRLYCCSIKGLDSMRVLIVDDVTFMRMTLRKILESAGYKVVGEATDGKQAVKMYLSLKPDVVTIDIQMPVMDGMDALRVIKSQDPKARVIVITGKGEETTIREAFRRGAIDFILKPVEPDRLLLAVKKIYKRLENN